MAVIYVRVNLNVLSFEIFYLLISSAETRISLLLLIRMINLINLAKI